MIRPHSKGNIGCTRIACVYRESLDNYVKQCKHDDYTQYLWIEINLGKENLYIAACYITNKELNYYSRFGLEGDKLMSTVSDKLHKVLITGDFNARVGKYKNMEISEGSIVDPCLLRGKGLYCDELWKNFLYICFNCTHLIVLNGIIFSFNKCTQIFTGLKPRKCSRLCIYGSM